MLGARYNLGIVGDTNHRSGYHIGPDRTPPGDYSEQLTRDRNGARVYPYYASAEDSGMGWVGSRSWLAALIVDARNRVPYTRDIREIIGSLDGKTALYWDSQTGFRAARYTGAGHLTHTHISFFRDSANRGHTDVLREYLEPPEPPEPPEEQETDMATAIRTDVKPGFAYDASGDNRIDPGAVTLLSGEWANGSAIETLGKARLTLLTDYSAKPVRLRIESLTRGADGEWWERIDTKPLYLTGTNPAWKAIPLRDGSHGVKIARIPVDGADTGGDWPITATLFYDTRK